MRKVYVIQIDMDIMCIYTSKKVALRKFVSKREDIINGKFYVDLHKDKVECKILSEDNLNRYIARVLFAVTETCKYHTMTLREYELNHVFCG